MRLTLHMPSGHTEYVKILKALVKSLAQQMQNPLAYGIFVTWEIGNYKLPVSQKNVLGFPCNFLPSCFCHVLRRCETSLGILENLLVREQRYNAQEALERICNHSGD